MSQPKFVIIDGNAIVHRAYHAIPPLTTKDGTMVNAVYGFVSMMFKMLNELRPEYIAITFDEAAPTFRHIEYKKYKATRVKADQALYDQIPLVRQVAEAFQFPVFSKSGYEADDVIGTLATMAHKEPVDVYIVTGDMDTLQLVNPKVKVYTLRKGLSDTIIYDEKMVNERFGFGPEKVVDYKAIRGDTSDNIPGVPGIGEKGATELIIKLQSIENIYKKFDELKKLGFKDGLIKRLEEGKDSAFMSKKLAAIDLNVPGIEFSLEKCKIKPFDREKIVSLFQRFEFVSLLKRVPEFRSVAEAEEESTKKKSKKIDKKDFKFQEVTKISEINKIIESIKSEKQFAARIVLDGADIYKNKIIGIALTVEKESYFLNFELVGKFFPIFEDQGIELVGHDLKQLVKILWLKKIPVSNTLFDVMVASYILNPGSRAHDIPSLMLKMLGKELTASSGQESLFGLDRRLVAYENFLVASISGQLKMELTEIDNLGLLEKVEMPLIPVLASMELHGVFVDLELLEKLSKKAAEQIKKVSEKIYALAGMEFNISSPLQLREVLFEKLQIPVEGIKKSKTGLSTSAEELEKLAGLHPIIPEISIHRELAKLQNTYIETLPKLINPKTGRIHSTFNQVVTATGRLSSSEPNLQNIPIRTELGREIRRAFIAEPGSLLISADYSQIELRVVASLAEDKKMLEIFEKGEDIHRATAAAIHGVPLDKVTKEMRYAAKEVNFGVLYGMGVYGLSWRADISHAEARKFIEKYFQEFSGVKKYIDQTLAFTKKEGYCETLFGRRRYLPELNSSNYQARSAAERMAINHPVQGTAADLMKMAMIDVHKYIKQNFSDEEVKMILQVHDELVFEVKEKLVAEVSKKVKEIMENVVKLRVPIKVEVASGKRWGDLK